MNSKHTLHAVLIVAGLTLGSMLTACIHDSNASSSGGTGSTALLRIVAFNGKPSTAKMQSRTVEAVNSASVSESPDATEAATNPAGTVLGVSTSCDPTSQAVCPIQSPTGYWFHVNLQSGDVQPLPFVYFTTTDCSGQAYLTVGSNQGNSITSTVALAGDVFTLQDGTAMEVPPPASQTTANVTARSQQTADGSCLPISLATSFLVAQANVPGTLGSDVSGPNVGGQITFNAPPQ